MKIIAFITEASLIKKILKYLDPWEEQARDPPVRPKIPDEIVYVPIGDAGWAHHENPGFTA